MVFLLEVLLVVPLMDMETIILKSTNLKRALSAALALAITAGVSTPALVAKASDTLPYLGESARGENQPYQHGYRAEDFLDWSPETEPYLPPPRQTLISAVKPSGLPLQVTMEMTSSTVTRIPMNLASICLTSGSILTIMVLGMVCRQSKFHTRCMRTSAA